jgi:hypothetical protein
MKNLKTLLYWIEERENIRRKKEAGEPKPWTDDPILRAYRFCNVRRMDDRVSKWLFDNWYNPYFDHRNMVVAVTLARHFNLPRTLEAIGFPLIWKPKLFKKILRNLKASGVSIFNGAYMVRGMAKDEPHYTPVKSDQIIDLVCTPLYEEPPPLNPDSMEESVAAFCPYWGFSSFMAGQVVADLRWAMLGGWFDAPRWAPIGPGSKRGINRLFGRAFNQPLAQLTFEQEMVDVIHACKDGLEEETTRRLEAMDYQNCLCEFDKYMRAKLGEGRPKQLYPGYTDA